MRCCSNAGVNALAVCPPSAGCRRTTQISVAVAPGTPSAVDRTAEVAMWARLGARARFLKCCHEPLVLSDAAPLNPRILRPAQTKSLGMPEKQDSAGQDKYYTRERQLGLRAVGGSAASCSADAACAPAQPAAAVTLQTPVQRMSRCLTPQLVQRCGAICKIPHHGEHVRSAAVGGVVSLQYQPAAFRATRAALAASTSRQHIHNPLWSAPLEAQSPRPEGSSARRHLAVKSP
jgi:hypothetical protein